MLVKIKNIIIGVPITFLKKSQNYFKIIGNSHTKETTIEVIKGSGIRPVINNKIYYTRIFIRKK